MITDGLNLAVGGDEVPPSASDYSLDVIDLAIDTLTGGAGRFVADTLDAAGLSRGLADLPPV